MVCLEYNTKKQFFLGSQLGSGLFLLVVGIFIFASGFLELSHYETIKNNDEKPKQIEIKSVDSPPGLFWLLSYDLNIEPIDSEFLEADKKIRISVHANSKQIMDDFTIFIFHDDLLDTYSNLFDIYMSDNSTNIPKLKNEWTSYAIFEVHDKTKCDMINDDNTIIRLNDCDFDYNAHNSHIFVNSGKYHLMFIATLEDGTRAGYFEKASMFSLRDSLEVDISNKMESIVMLTESQQNLNFRAEGLSLIGIGIAMILGGITLFEYLSNYEKELDKKEKSHQHLLLM